MTTTTTTQSKVFASLAKRGGKGVLLFARKWKRQNTRRRAMASKRSKTVSVTKCEKKAMSFPRNLSNFFTPLLAFTKANEFEKRSERAYLEYPVRSYRFYITCALYYALMMCSMMLTFFPLGLRRKNPLFSAKRESKRSGDNLSIRSKLEIASV